MTFELDFEGQMILTQTDREGVPWAEGMAYLKLWKHDNVLEAERCQCVKILKALPGSLGPKTM